MLLYRISFNFLWGRANVTQNAEMFFIDFGVEKNLMMDSEAK